MANTITLTNNISHKRISSAKTLKKTTMADYLKKSGSLVLIALMFIVGTLLALGCHIPVENVMGNYSYDVLVILIAMELFTNLIAETGIMQMLAIKIAEISKGRKRNTLRTPI